MKKLPFALVIEVLEGRSSTGGGRYVIMYEKEQRRCDIVARKKYLGITTYLQVVLW